MVDSVMEFLATTNRYYLAGGAALLVLLFFWNKKFIKKVSSLVVTLLFVGAVGFLVYTYFYGEPGSQKVYAEKKESKPLLESSYYQDPDTILSKQLEE